MQAIGATVQISVPVDERADPRRYRSARVVTAIWGMLSGPMAETGRAGGGRQSGRVRYGSRRARRPPQSSCIIRSRWRCTAILGYMITGIIPMKEHERLRSTPVRTIWLYARDCSSGWRFAYFRAYLGLPRRVSARAVDHVLHGVLLAAALWPWRKEYAIPIQICAPG